MRPTPALLLPALLLLLPGCRGHRGLGPDWARSAPAGTTVAFSGEAGWILDRPDFQEALRRFPMAEQSLDLFLKKAGIAPKQDKGRISLYVMDLKIEAKEAKPQVQIPRFLIQLAGFQDTEALQRAVVESFPGEGSLSVGGREWPLHVILDVNQWHIRALMDGEDRVWLGDLASLAALTGARRPDPGLVAASAWVDAQAELQGFLRPEAVIQGAQSALPAEAQSMLPRGLDALVWSVSPGKNPEAPFRFALSVTGSREGIQRAAPWIQRFVALAGTSQGRTVPSAEMIEEPTRVGFRAQLTGSQLEATLGRLAAPYFRFGSPQEPDPKP